MFYQIKRSAVLDFICRRLRGRKFIMYTANEGRNDHLPSFKNNFLLPVSGLPVVVPSPTSPY